MIEALDLAKRHDGRDILLGATLRVARGKVAVLIGPSGSGKSTFLRCLIGLDRFDAGPCESAIYNSPPIWPRVRVCDSCDRSA